MYPPFVLIVSTKFRECMLFWCTSFLTRELKYCDGAFCTQKFKYICYTEAFEDDSVSTFNYFVYLSRGELSLHRGTGTSS